MSRVLFVVPSLARAGAETQLVDLVNGLDPAKYEKHLLSFESNLDQLIRVRRNEVMFHHAPRRHRLDFSVARQIARVIDEQRIEVVHCTLQFALLMGWLGLRHSRRRPRFLVTLHSTVNRDLKSEIFDRAVYQWMMRACHRIICVCRAQQQHWVGKYPFLRERSTVVHNGVDTAIFDPAPFAWEGAQLRRALGIAENTALIAHIAAFRPEKGHLLLLDAFAKLRAAGQEASLLFAGDGVLRAEVEQQARTLGLLPHVRFLGVVSDVRPILAAADLSVLPSYAETFSMAMLESLAMGVPVVATDMGGTREAVLHEQTGLLVPPRDSEELADALIRMVSDAPLRRAFGARGQELVRTNFSRERMIRSTEQVLAGA